MYGYLTSITDAAMYGYLTSITDAAIYWFNIHN